MAATAAPRDAAARASCGGTSRGPTSTGSSCTPSSNSSPGGGLEDSGASTTSIACPAHVPLPSPQRDGGAGPPAPRRLVRQDGLLRHHVRRRAPLLPRLAARAASDSPRGPVAALPPGTPADTAAAAWRSERALAAPVERCEGRGRAVVPPPCPAYKQHLVGALAPHTKGPARMHDGLLGSALELDWMAVHARRPVVLQGHRQPVGCWARCNARLAFRRALRECRGGRDGYSVCRSGAKPAACHCRRWCAPSLLASASCRLSVCVCRLVCTLLQAAACIEESRRAPCNKHLARGSRARRLGLVAASQACLHASLSCSASLGRQGRAVCTTIHRAAGGARACTPDEIAVQHAVKYLARTLLVVGSHRQIVLCRSGGQCADDASSNVASHSRGAGPGSFHAARRYCSTQPACPARPPARRPCLCCSAAAPPDPAPGPSWPPSAAAPPPSSPSSPSSSSSSSPRPASAPMLLTCRQGVRSGSAQDQGCCPTGRRSDTCSDASRRSL
jgi:hypothetical protein